MTVNINHNWLGQHATYICPSCDSYELFYVTNQRLELKQGKPSRIRMHGAKKKIELPYSYLRSPHIDLEKKVGCSDCDETGRGWDFIDLISFQRLYREICESKEEPDDSRAIITYIKKHRKKR